MSTLKDEWVKKCLYLARRPAFAWSGGTRKILYQQMVTFLFWDDSLQLEDVGYTSAKMRQLERLYLHEESRAIAVELWERRREMAKYGSVGFATYGHLVKGGDSVEEVVAKKSRIASVQGPCLQSVTVTWVAKNQVEVDAFYRSTEFFKKFPADLVFMRDVLLQPFDFSGMELTVTCHFANMTIHPMYWATVLAHVDDPVAEMERIREKDPRFHKHLVTHTAHYVCSEHGRSIANHSQSQRVKKHALAAIRGTKLRELREYMREAHIDGSGRGSGSV